MGSLKSYLGSNMRRSNVRYRRQQAFTLIELLVVISVILIAASIVVVTGRGGSGAALSSSTRIVSSVVQGARGQAIMKNQRARLIIYANSDLNSDENAADPDKFLRFFGIVYADPDDPNPSNPTNWIAATQGTYLPRGIYFDPASATRNSTSSGWSAASRNFQIEFPRGSSVGEGGANSSHYYWYEFQSNGRASDPNAWLVIRSGFLNQEGSVDFTREEDAMLKAALIIRQAGTATIVTDPSAISEID
jgi:prepilin-type N-terminal cleavage/methylation domain-containing protein